LIVVCPFVFFLLAIVPSVLRYTDSDRPFGIFKLFLRTVKKHILYDMYVPKCWLLGG